MVRRLVTAVVAGVLATGCAPRAAVRPGGRGEVVIEYRGDAREVTLLGTMTAWRRLPLQQVGRRFELTLKLPPGRYEYRLEVRDALGWRVVVPEEAEQADDEFGGQNAVLRVP